LKGIEAEGLCSELNDGKKLATDIQYFWAIIIIEWAFKTKALKYHFKSLELKEVTGNEMQKANSYINLGNVFVANRRK